MAFFGLQNAVSEIPGFGALWGRANRLKEVQMKWGLKVTLCNSCTLVCDGARSWPFGPF